MTDEDRIDKAAPGHFAKLMAKLDEPERDWAIDHADNAIDARPLFEWLQLSRHMVAVEYIWDDEE